MKKSSDSLAEQILEVPNFLLDEEDTFETQELLIFLTNLEDFKIEGANLNASRFFGCFKNGLISLNSICSFEDFIHPEDYKLFINHLKKCKNLKPDEQKLISVRIKISNRKWEKFEFRHRLYKAQENKIFGVAKKASHKDFSEEMPENLAISAEKVVKKTRSKYELLINSIDDAFCSIEVLFDREGKAVDYLFIETNPAFDKHVQLKEAEGKTMKEIAPDHEEYWFEMYGKIALTGKPVRFQNFAEQLGNIWFDVYAFSEGNKGNGRVFILFSNVTEKKILQDNLTKANDALEKKVQQRTRELKENSELLQIIFDTTNEGIVVFEPIYDQNKELVDFRYLRVNKVVLHQYDRQEMEGQLFLEINPGAKEIGIFNIFKQTLETGEAKDFEIFYDKNEYENWFRITTKSQNELLIVSLEDITRRKKEAQELKDTLRFKRQLAKTSPDIIMIFNLFDEKINYINRDLAPRIGMKKRDILNMPLSNIVPFIHPRDREKGLEFHQKLMTASDRDIVEIEFRLKAKNGKWEWYNALGKVFMRTKRGNVGEYMILLRNIDKQMSTQKALSHAERLSIKGEVAQTLAHELRNPLASIGMAADILNSKMPKDADGHMNSLIDVIKRSATVLNKLVTDLLTSSNYSPASLEKNCLASILEDALKMAGDRIYLAGITVKKNYTGNYYINADPEKLKIAFLNILVNASEAMTPQEGIIDLSIEKKNDDLVLRIQDNGCGLEPDQLDKLFDAFYTQKAYGIGVGLNSVKSILEEHDAKITVTSEPNKGTIFHLSFHCYELNERS